MRPLEVLEKEVHSFTHETFPANSGLIKEMQR